eukprot:TRINITY_DN34651_c0_g1_i1.p1 TRINITY_DN34651_c0_g1~~TRINITY_DN34651_c0_g1_i1.p1  ORF type:complete len:124 (-),score=17.15 TRINITY_DN34651_c0_g1_i1:61-432(-)
MMQKALDTLKPRTYRCGRIGSFSEDCKRSACAAEEVVNPRGFNADGIERAWSVVKRWIRRRCGGRMPRHSVRDAQKLLSKEFQRHKLNATEMLGYGHAYFAALEAFVAAVTNGQKMTNLQILH